MLIAEYDANFSPNFEYTILLTHCPREQDEQVQMPWMIVGLTVA